jgi:hypothetical protein
VCTSVLVRKQPQQMTASYEQMQYNLPVDSSSASRTGSHRDDADYPVYDDIRDEGLFAPRCIPPMDIAPGVSAPVALVGNMRNIFAGRRILCLRFLLQGDACEALQIREAGERSLRVVGMDKDIKAGALHIHGQRIDLCPRHGDAIVRVNGLAGAEPMLEELRREPESLALVVLRPIGASGVARTLPGKRDSATSIFRLDGRLDNEMARMAEDVQWSVLLDPLEGKLAQSMVKWDVATMQVAKAELEEQAMEVPIAYGTIFDDYNKRIFILKRRADVRKDLAKLKDRGQPEEYDYFVATLALQDAMADPEHDAEKLEQAMEMFKTQLGSGNANLAGKLLLKRAKRLLGLAEERVLFNRMQTELPELSRGASKVEGEEVLWLRA